MLAFALIYFIYPFIRPIADLIDGGLEFTLTVGILVCDATVSVRPR
jgi:hypothetical protein